MVSCSQAKHPTTKQSDVLELKMLSGKWRLEADQKVNYVFEKSSFIQIYGKDTLADLSYTFSSSCNLKDSVSKINLRTTSFLLIYSKDGKIDQCHEILGLSDILSLRDPNNGKLFVFNKSGK